MSCWGNDLNDKEWEEREAGVCEVCGNPVDKYGRSADKDNCSYSTVRCKKCGWSPCDLSC